MDGYTLDNVKPYSTLASWHVREIGLTSSSLHLGGVTLGRGCTIVLLRRGGMKPSQSVELIGNN